MRGVEMLILALVAALMIFFVARPLLKGAGPPAQLPVLVTSSGDGLPPASALMAYEGEGQLALAGPDVDATIDIAKIEGQVRASSVKKVSEFVEKHPEASVSIIRNWLHEASS